MELLSKPEPIELDLEEWVPGGAWVRSRANEEVGRVDRSNYKSIFYIIHEVHGKFDAAELADDNASLLVFQIENKADDPYAHFLRLKVTLKCARVKPSDEAPFFYAADPALRGEQVLESFIINRSKSFTTGASVNVQGSSFVSGSTNVSSTTADSYEVRERHTISARIEKSSARAVARDTSWWELKAAPHPGQGIGDYLTVAVVVKRGMGQQFTITAEVEAELSNLSDKFRRINPFHRKTKAVMLGTYGPKPTTNQAVPDGVDQNSLKDSTESPEVVRKNLQVGVHLPEMEPPLVTSDGPSDALKPQGQHSEQTPPSGGTSVQQQTMTTFTERAVVKEPSKAPPSPHETLESEFAMEKAAPPAHDAVSGTTNMPKTRPIIVDNRYPAKSPLDRRPIELPANSPPASPARPVPSNARADRHLKMAVLYQRLAQLHTEEAMEMLGQHATSYADEVESTRWVPRQM